MMQRQNKPQATDPLAELAEPGEVFRNPAQVEFIRTFARLIRDAFSKVIFRDRAVPSFIMQSDTGKSYKVSIANDGTLQTEYIRG